MLLWCRTCFEIINDDRYSNVNSVLPDYEPEKIINESLGECLPGLDLQIVNNAVMCEPCVELLSKLQSFRNGCFETEDKIRMYIVKHGPACVDLNLDIVPDVEIESDSEETKEIPDRKDVLKTEEDLIDIEDNRIEEPPGDPPEDLSEGAPEDLSEAPPADDDASEEESSEETRSASEGALSAAESDCTYCPSNSESDDSCELPPSKRKRVQTRSSIVNSTRSSTSSNVACDTKSSLNNRTPITSGNFITLSNLLSSNCADNKVLNSLNKQANNGSILLNILASDRLKDKPSPSPKTKRPSQPKHDPPVVSIELLPDENDSTAQPMKRPFPRKLPLENVSRFVCLVCIQSFGELPLLYMHMDGQHKTELGAFMQSIGTELPKTTDAPRGLYECPLCLQRFGFISGWQAHMRDHTEVLKLFAGVRKNKILNLSRSFKGKPFRCTICRDSFPNATAIYEHMNKDHQKDSSQLTVVEEQPQPVPPIPPNFQMCTICKALLYDPSPQEVDAHMQIHTLHVIPPLTPAKLTQNSKVAGNTSKTAEPQPVLVDAQTTSESETEIPDLDPASRSASPIILDDSDEDEPLPPPPKMENATRSTCPHCGNLVEDRLLGKHIDRHETNADRLISGKSFNPAYMFCSFCAKYVKTADIECHLNGHIAACHVPSARPDLWIAKQNLWFCSFCCKYIKFKESRLIRKHIRGHVTVACDEPATGGRPEAAKQQSGERVEARKAPLVIDLDDSEPEIVGPDKPGTPAEPCQTILPPQTEPPPPPSRAEADEIEFVDVTDDGDDVLLCEICSELVPSAEADKHRLIHSESQQLGSPEQRKAPQSFDDAYQTSIRDAQDADDFGNNENVHNNLIHGALDLSRTTSQEPLGLTNPTPDLSASSRNTPPATENNVSVDSAVSIPNSETSLVPVCGSSNVPPIPTYDDAPSSPAEHSSDPPQFLSRSTVSEIIADRTIPPEEDTSNPPPGDCNSDVTLIPNSETSSAHVDGSLNVASIQSDDGDDDDDDGADVPQFLSLSAVSEIAAGISAENTNDPLALEESSNPLADCDHFEGPATSTTPPPAPSEIFSNDSAIATDDGEEVMDLTCKEKISDVEVTTFSYDMELHSVKPVQEQERDNFESMFSLSTDPSLSMAPPDSLDDDDETSPMRLFTRKPEQSVTANVDLSHAFDHRPTMRDKAAERGEAGEKDGNEEATDENKKESVNEKDEIGEETAEKDRIEEMTDENKNESTNEKDELGEEAGENDGKEEKMNGLEKHEGTNEKKEGAKVSVYGTRSRTRKDVGGAFSSRRAQRNVAATRKRKR